MILLMPVGGSGTRFREAGYTIPKPLLPVGDHPLIWHAIQSYVPLHPTWIALLRVDSFAYHLHRLFPSTSVIIPISHETTGPLETIRMAPHLEVLLQTQEELLIADCDSLLDPYELQLAINHFRASQADGGVTVRNTSDPSCSFALIRDGLVLETREKDPFTTCSTTGPYWWAKSEQFLACAIQGFTQGLRTISPVYNLAIHDGARIIPYPVTSFQHLGSPAEYEAYLKHLRPSL